MSFTGVSRAGDVSMFVRHEVADYGAWRKAFDAFAPTQKKAGLIHKAVYQSTDDPNDVTVIHEFRSLEKAKAFAALPELRAAMEKGGVKGAPQIWYPITVTRDRQQRVRFDRWQPVPNLEVLNLVFGTARPVPRGQSGSSRPLLAVR